MSPLRSGISGGYPMSDSIGSFSELNLSAPLLQALADVGYENPSPIQQACIPPLLEGLDVREADEAFVTGTFAGLVPVNSVDGRVLGSAQAQGRPMIHRLQTLYRELIRRDVAARGAHA